MPTSFNQLNLDFFTNFKPYAIKLLQTLITITSYSQNRQESLLICISLLAFTAHNSILTRPTTSV